MKISKLFHWLYGFLMLMPILSVLVSSLYVVFNDNAKDSYSVQYVSSQLELALPNTLNDGFDYLVKYDDNVGTTGIKVRYSNISVDWYSLGANPQYIYDRFYLVLYSDGHTNIYLYDDDGAPKNSISDVWGYTLFDFSFTKLGTQSNYQNGANRIFTQYIISNTLDNVFTYSLNQLKDNDLYNWSLDSFLSTPFTYILDLFDVPNNSVMLLLLSYWLDISIIWLTFDVLMYVPLLTHRWLDKGVLE